MTLPQRARQTFAAISSRPDDACKHLVGQYLTLEQATAFREMSSHDQAHSCRVCAKVKTSGDGSMDLIVATLLHDIGKVSERGRVRLGDRVVKVLLAKVFSQGLQKLAARPAPRWLEGLSLAVHHSELGAKKAASLGCSDRTCWLIGHHEDETPISDEELCLLVAADRETV